MLALPPVIPAGLREDASSGSRSRPILAVLVVVSLLTAGCVTHVEKEEDDDAADPVPRCGAPCASMIAEGSLWEPHVAVDPTDPDRIVAVSVDLASRSTDPTQYHWPLVHVSTDGGEHWTTRRLEGGPTAGPTHPLAGYNNIEEPVLAFLPDGTLLLSLLGITNHPGAYTGGELLVLRSTDGGATFPDIVTVQGSKGATTFGLEGPEKRMSDTQDKQWMDVFPDGRVLMVWSRNFAGHPECGADELDEECTVLSWSVSADGGLDWSPAAPVEEDGLYSGAYPVVRRDGGWLVTYRDTRTSEIRVAVSEDEGTTWRHDAFGVSTKFPVIDSVDGPDGERLLLVYPESEEGRDSLQTVMMRTSHDGGATWSDAHALAGPTHEGRTIPALATTDDTAFTMFWHPHEDGADLVVRSYRNDTLSPPFVLDTTEGPTAETGDYMGLAAHPEGGAYAVWVARHDGTLGLHGARLYLE